MVKIRRARCGPLAAATILLGLLSSPASGSSIIELIGADPFIYPLAPGPTIFFAADPPHALINQLQVEDVSIKFNAASSVDITPPGSPYTLYSVGVLASLNAQLQGGPHITGTSSSEAELRIEPPVPIFQGFRAPLLLDNTLLSLPGAGGYPSFMLRIPSGSPASGELLMTTDGQWISSFFDVFTELSVDGGQNWIPASGAMHMGQVPEPSSIGMGSVGGLVLAWLGVRRRKSRMRVPSSPRNH